MPSLLAALSPDESRVAALIPGSAPSSSIRVQILSSQTATLQTTLLHRRNAGADSGSGATGSPNHDASTAVQKVMFVSDSLVAAVVASDLIVVWDLNRGVAACTIQPKHKHHQKEQQQASSSSSSSSLAFCDMVTAGGKLYALVWSSETNKAQIHIYKPETGKLEQKIKAGSKEQVVALAVAGHNAVVRQEDGALRVLNMKNGQKLCKCAPSSTTTTTTTKNNAQQLAMVGDLIATIDSGEVVFIHCTTGQRVGSVACDHADDDLEFQSLAAAANNNINRAHSAGCLLRLGSKVYTVSLSSEDASSSFSAEATLLCRILAAPSVDARILLLGGASKSIYALLLKANQFQMAMAAVGANANNNDKDKNELTLDWVTPVSSKTKEQNAAAAKRKKDAVAVLGPAQVGGEARGIVDGPVSKKPRAEKKNKGDDSDDDGEANEDVEMKDADGEQDDAAEKDDEGPSIADRLRKLQEAFDAEEEEDATEGDKAGGNNTDFQPKKATTESLTQVLEQALQSSDDAMLELALNVRDSKILRETCEKLSDEYLPALLNALTSRLASRPTRANQLCPWISTLLKTGRIRSVAHLQPLRNLLQERLEIFPALLKLEGRLGMMTNL